MSFTLTGNFLSNARGVNFVDGGGVTWTFNPNTNSVSATSSGGGGSGTVTSIGSTSLTIGGTSAIPTVNLSSTQITNIGLGGTALQTAAVADSIQGTGASGSPLELVGDSATPGNSFHYGTNGSGTKGWYADTGGTVTSVSLTDASTAPIFTIGSSGSTAVALTSTLKTQTANTFLRGPVSGVAAQPTFGPIVAADLISLTAIPGTIPDLVMWWESDDILATAATSLVTRLRERTPWITGTLAGNISNLAPTVDATPLNGLPIIKWGTATPGYILTTPPNLPIGATFFAVVKPNNSTTGQAIFGSNTSGLALYLCTVASPKVNLTKSGTSVIGTSTVSWTAGAAFQVNVTYVSATGAFAFRQGRTGAGSGTGATAAGTATTNAWIGADTGVTVSELNLASLALLMIFNRVLTSTEILAVEAYILAKWGV